MGCRTGGAVGVECLVVMTSKRVTAGAECVHQTRSIGDTPRAVCVGGHTVPVGTTWPRYSRRASLKALDLVWCELARGDLVPASIAVKERAEAMSGFAALEFSLEKKTER